MPGFTLTVTSSLLINPWELAADTVTKLRVISEVRGS